MLMMRKVNDEDAWVCTGRQIRSTGHEEQTFIIMLHQTEASWRFHQRKLPFNFFLVSFGLDE